MLKINNKYQCSGCAACADVCPAHCIEYRHDAAGFIYPSIDAAACIGCGACERVCPIIPGNAATREAGNCFAAWANDQHTHRKSSSGGLGYVLAKSVIGRGGVVYGCSAADPTHIRHIRVEDIESLAELQGSKYVQSDTRGVYRQIKEDIKRGREVLFIGTPCQVSAVRNIYRKYPENLYTADLICHGVPSQKMLNEQFRSISRQIPESVSFRDGNEYRLKLTYPDRKAFSGSVWSVPYFRVFYKGFSFRPSCYRCPYAGDKRAGDITIGDFWGIKEPENLPEQARDGISAVLVSTPKGQRLLEAITPELEIHSRPVQEAVSGNDQLRHPVKETCKAKIFRTLYPALPLRAAVAACIVDSKAATLARMIKRKFIG